MACSADMGNEGLGSSNLEVGKRPRDSWDLNEIAVWVGETIAEEELLVERPCLREVVAFFFYSVIFSS